MALLIEWRRKI